MAKEGNGFPEKLLATFRAEAEEHLRAMSSALDEIERGAAPATRAELVEVMFRDAHSLKGASRAINRRDIEAVCRALESAFAALKSSRAVVTPELCESLRRALDALAGMKEAGAGASGVPPPLGTLLRRLESIDAGSARGAQAARAQEPEAAGGTGTVAPAGQASPAPQAASVRIGVARLDSVMRGAEGLLSARIAAGQRLKELREANAALASWRKEAAAAGAGLPPIAAEVHKRLGRLAGAAERDERALAALTGALLRQVREMHLLPFATLLEGFPRTARDLAREQDKKVEVTITGGQIEIDRRILQELREPLLHLVRNCVDHGIESPALREAAGKSPQGRIAFTVAQRDGGRIEITVADDGGGIDVAKVVGRAREMGIPVPAQGPAARESLELVFQSGVTTRAMITDVSGRGLGLAIVREKVEKLDGRVEIDSQPGTGTRFRLVIPHSLATYRGVVVRAAERSFVVPSAAVVRVARVRRSEMRTVEGRETIALDGRALALVRLTEVLGLPRRPHSVDAGEFLRFLVLGEGGGCIAFEVDEVIGEHEVLVKTLGPQLPRVRNVAGACVIGTGELVPVLGAADLLRSAAVARPAARETDAHEREAQRPRSILVVEDSITARSLLQNILEVAGYRVATAVDGMDALAALRANDFDLVVSDVEMPRMDGFELTTRIRADRRLSDLPVVLVTALGTREHRERGLEAGASAYLVKSDFEQSNLLETVRRLS
jgi:two-component system chemotaxis sensor kinase CheA